MHGRGMCMVGVGMEGEHAWQGGMHGKGHAWQGGMCVAGGHVWQEDMYGRGCAWQGAHVCLGDAWHGGMHGRGHAWHAPPPNQILRDAVNERAVRILLECILVFLFIRIRNYFQEHFLLQQYFLECSICFLVQQDLRRMRAKRIPYSNAHFANYKHHHCEFLVSVMLCASAKALRMFFLPV